MLLVMSVSDSNIVARRLRGTFLVGSPHRTGAELVRALGAVQAQDFPGAKWALGMRARGTTDASIQQEVDAGRILRTHVLRPTWHFVAPEDIRWMQGAHRSARESDDGLLQQPV